MTQAVELIRMAMFTYCYVDQLLFNYESVSSMLETVGLDLVYDQIYISSSESGDEEIIFYNRFDDEYIQFNLTYSNGVDFTYQEKYDINELKNRDSIHLTPIDSTGYYRWVDEELSERK